MTDNQPTASGVSEEMVEAALREWLTRGGYTFAKTDLLAKEPAFAKAMRAALEAALSASPPQPIPTPDEIIKHMVNRFLGWNLPEEFKPDAGISYTPPYGCWSSRLSGTNLFDATQADAMVRYMVEGLPVEAIQPTPDEALRDVLAQECERADNESTAYNVKRGIYELIPVDIALAAMSRVAALSRARPEEADHVTGVPVLDAAVKRLMVLDQESVFALVDIAEERVRQISGEGWSPEHDNAYDSGEMAKAAAAYALAPHTHKYANSECPTFWPWGQHWFKPKSMHLNRVRAGALLVAELARYFRTASKTEA